MAEIIAIGDGADQARSACRAAMDSAGLSLAHASREIGDGVSAATLGRWLRGTYTGDVPAVTARIEAWLLTRREGDALSLAEAGLDRHAETDAATSIDDALAYAHSSKDIVLIHGPSGRGKTSAAEGYRATHSRVFYMPATRAMATMVGLLTCLGEAIGAYPASISALNWERAIIARLRQGNSLVIIDEAHHLRDALLDELRCIRDNAGCGLALIGNDAVLMSIRRCPQILGRTGSASTSSTWRPMTWPPSPQGRSAASRRRASSSRWSWPRAAPAACIRCAACWPRRGSWRAPRGGRASIPTAS